MTIIQRLDKLLSSDKVQRICYVVALTIWISLAIKNHELRNVESSLGIKYFWIMMIPAILLTMQITFNKTFTWILIFILIGVYSIWTLVSLIIFIIIDQGRAYVKAIIWTFPEIAGLLLLVLALLTINFITLKLRPKK
jgi:hypothetical protein